MDDREKGREKSIKPTPPLPATAQDCCKDRLQWVPPDRPKAPEVEFSTKEFLHEEVKIYRQPDHCCAQTG